MQKPTLLLLLLLPMFIGKAQELPSAKTENHQQINGTNIFMVPPPLFSEATNFKGFQNPLDPTSMIMTMVIPGPFSEVSKGFNAETLKTKGMDLHVIKEINVGIYQGLYLELDQSANGMIFSKNLLVYGDEKATSLINGVYLKDSTEIGKHVKSSILSTYLDNNINANPRAALAYAIDENVGGLKFHSVIGNGMLFNRDLKLPTESEDKASLVIDKSFAEMKISDKKAFCMARIKKYPGDYSVTPDKGINEITIDGLSGYALFAFNNDQGNEEMYQVILFDHQGDYYIFVGTYLTGSDKAEMDIKNIINTFKRK